MSSLLALSNSFADPLEQAGSAVIAVNAGTRVSPSGIHWRNGIIKSNDDIQPPMRSWYMYHI